MGSFCNTLEDLLKIESCSVEPAGQVRSARSVANSRNELTDDEGSGETETPDTDGSTTEKPDTDASAIHFISFTALLTVLVSLFL